MVQIQLRFICDCMLDLLQLVYAKEKISPACAERAKLQFEVFLERVKTDFKVKLDSFTEDRRLDDFYCELLNTKDFSDIWEVVKLVLILSHGNASVESGFSINKGHACGKSRRRFINWTKNSI